MLRTVLTVAGKPGLYKLVSSGRNMLIVEALDATKKRMPIHGVDKVVSLGDIAIIPMMRRFPCGRCWRM